MDQVQSRSKLRMGAVNAPGRSTTKSVGAFPFMNSDNLEAYQYPKSDTIKQREPFGHGIGVESHGISKGIKLKSGKWGPPLQPEFDCSAFSAAIRQGQTPSVVLFGRHSHSPSGTLELPLAIGDLQVNS